MTRKSLWRTLFMTLYVKSHMKGVQRTVRKRGKVEMAWNRASPSNLMELTNYTCDLLQRVDHPFPIGVILNELIYLCLGW